jgi:branched-chain amino acid transport system permease protein
MISNTVRSGLVLGLVGGLLTLPFGGWSPAVLGTLSGLGLGLMLGGRMEKKDPVALVREAFPAAVAFAFVFLALSLFQNFVVAPISGNFPADPSVVMSANITGVLTGAVIVLVIAALHGLPKIIEDRGRMLIFAVIIISFPFVDNFTALRWTALVIFALIYVILGMGLNIVVGYAGLLDLGYAAFFAIGAYTTGILSSTGSVLYQNGHILVNFWIVIWIAAAVAAVFGLLLGAPTLPLRGDYLAIVTLGFGEIIPIVFRNLIDVSINEPITCGINALQRALGTLHQIPCVVLASHLDLTEGEKGINPISRPVLPFIGHFTSQNPIPWYFLIIAIILFSIFLIGRLRESRLGRAWMAIREDELAASQMGINPVRTKLLAFSMGATFSGFAGAFYGSYIAGIFPGAFEFSTSIIVLCIVILGGIGNVTGVIIGGLVIEIADRLVLPALKDLFNGILHHSILPALAHHPIAQAAFEQNANPILYRSLFFGLTLVIMMAVRPEGLLPNARRRKELHEFEESGGALSDSGGPEDRQ